MLGPLAIMAVAAAVLIGLAQHAPSLLPTAGSNVTRAAPLSFIENKGQVEGAAKFYLQEPAATILFAPGGLIMTLAGSADLPDQSLRVDLLGANPNPPIVSLGRAAGTVNVFHGNDPDGWHTDIPTHSRIAYQQPWPGVDVRYQGETGQLESVYEIAPGADPAAIRLRYSGHDRLSIDATGNLVVSTPLGEVVESAPIVYQGVSGERIYVDGEYVLLDSRTVGFRVGAYDRSRALVIDPTLAYSTFLGGTGSDQGNSIAVDSGGNVYLAGLTTSTDFPATGGGFQTTSAGDRDAFVAKFDSSGSLVYATYLGGSGFDQANGIAIDASGNAYVAGLTASANFPTLGALQPTAGGGDDAFVTKLNPTGSALVYSTYLGGADDEEARGIAIDGSDSAYVAGDTLSTNFPVLNAVQPLLVDDDAFVAKLNAAGSALVFSTYLGGLGIDEASAIAVDGSGGAYVTGFTFALDFPTLNPLQSANGGGRDAFVAKFTSAGARVYGTYLGGAGTDHGRGIAVDASDNAYVAGLTASTDFPTSNPYQASNGGSDDVFVTKVNAAGSALTYSTYLGGSAADGASSIALDAATNAYITGSTFSADFPTADPIQAIAGGASDALAAKLSAAGASLVYATYLGGSGTDRGWGIAVDSSDNAYLAGTTLSANFPTANPSQSANAGLFDSFVAKIDPAAPVGTPTPTPTPTVTPTPTNPATPQPTPTAKNPAGDTDGDTIPNGTDTDDDNDGCLDTAELNTAPGSQTSGGLRDPHLFWDFMDVWTGSPPARDKSVVVGDIGAVVARFGTVRGSTPTKQDAFAEALTPPLDLRSYHTDFDRGGADPTQNAWNLLPPDGSIVIGDIGAVVAQFGSSCA